jgi:putative salt-induced outer membrane protein YdiY
MGFMNVGRQWWTIGLAIGWAMLLGVDVAGADILETKGRSYIGTLDSLRQGDVSFEIDAIDETVIIDIDDVTNLETVGPRFVVFGTTDSMTGFLLGIQDGHLLVQPEADPEAAPETDPATQPAADSAPAPTEGAKASPAAPTVVRIPLEELWSVDDPVRNFVAVFLGNYLRYWSGNLDLGVTATQATTDTSQFLISIAGKREKGDLEIGVAATYRSGRQKEQGSPSTKSQDEIDGQISVRYDIHKPYFIFGEVQATYDAIQFLSIRTQPVLGVGYDLVDTDDASLSAKFGSGWIYEKYFPNSCSAADVACDDSFAALSFGIEGDWELPWDAALSGSLSYRPSLTNWSDNYLIQARAAATLPLTSHLSFKLSVKNDYNNQPSEDAIPNSFYFNVALSLTL